MNSWLIGFDVRAAKDRYVRQRWNPAARTEYLLRPEIEWPLSVDRRVWPSVFYAGADKHNKDSYATIEFDPEILAGSYWLDLLSMRRHYDRHRALAPDGVFIGVELVSENEADGDTILYKDTDGHQCGLTLPVTVPGRLPEGSTLLGYDVAGAARVSGLANTQYTADEIRELSPAWSDRLNEFGLLKTLDDAAAFRQVSDRRDPAYAPYWIYALWRLPAQ